MAKKANGRSLVDFGTLSPAEQELLEKCATDESVTFGSGNRPDRPKDGPVSNRIRAKFLRFMMLGGDEAALVHEEGVQLRGAWIEGELVLDGADLPHDIALNNCWFDSKISLIAAQTRRIDLDGSRVARLSGEGAEIKGDVFLRDTFRADYGVSFSGAAITGDLDCRRSTFKKLKGNALNFDRATIKGSVFLNSEFEAEGAVTFFGARIAGNLDCSKGKFENHYGCALLFDSARIEGGINLGSDFSATGAVKFSAANIAGNLDCGAGKFENPSRAAIAFDGAEIGGCAWLNNGFSGTGVVKLIGAKIGGDLDCQNGIFSDPHPTCAVAVDFDRAEIRGNVSLNKGCCANGVTRLRGAKISGDLSCEAATFLGAPVEALAELGDKTRIALNANRAHVEGCFYLRHLDKVEGNIRLAHTHAGVLCDHEGVINKLKVDGASRFYLDGFTYGRLNSAAPVDWSIRLKWLESQPEQHLDKEFKKKFRPQPWEQLIKVLREMGHLEQARKIAIAKEDHLRKIGTLIWFVQPFHFLYGKLAGYGHRPSWLVRWMCGIWLGCGIFYYWAASEALFGPLNPIIFNNIQFAHCAPMTPDCVTLKKQKVGNWWLCPDLPGEYTSFSPFVYSLDLIMPVVGLGQEKDWRPITPPADNFPAFSRARLHGGEQVWRDHMGNLVRWVTWIENLFGWAASLPMVATRSGLVKRDD